MKHNIIVQKWQLVCRSHCSRPMKVSLQRKCVLSYWRDNLEPISHSSFRLTTKMILVRKSCCDATLLHVITFFALNGNVLSDISYSINFPSLPLFLLITATPIFASSFIIIYIDSATADKDYAGLPNTISFMSGQSIGGVSCTNITIIDDTIEEGVENFNIKLSSDFPGIILSRSLGMIEITDNDGGSSFNSSTLLHYYITYISYSIINSFLQFLSLFPLSLPSSPSLHPHMHWLVKLILSLCVPSYTFCRRVKPYNYTVNCRTSCSNLSISASHIITDHHYCGCVLYSPETNKERYSWSNVIQDWLYITAPGVLSLSDPHLSSRSPDIPPCSRNLLTLTLILIVSIGFIEYCTRIILYSL